VNDEFYLLLLLHVLLIWPKSSHWNISDAIEHNFQNKYFLEMQW